MEKCIVCDRPATKYNSQQLPVCKPHETHEALNLDCPLCKKALDVRKGKYGTFFICPNCGIVNRTKLKQFGNVFFAKKG
jgi:predicted RNA-binding Zn-ribbon protein involved in translation (DUF1610 family)